MLGSRVALRDIDDVDGFVAATIQRFERDAEFELEEDEREELHAEGLCILVELERKFEPHRPGYTGPGRFSGFAAMFLPRRLGDAWHQRHPEHRRITLADGSRQWQYLKRSVSLDAVTENLNSGSGGELDERRLLDPKKWTAVPAAA